MGRDRGLQVSPTIKGQIRVVFVDTNRATRRLDDPGRDGQIGIEVLQAQDLLVGTSGLCHRINPEPGYLSKPAWMLHRASLANPATRRRFSARTSDPEPEIACNGRCSGRE